MWGFTVFLTTRWLWLSLTASAGCFPSVPGLLVAGGPPGPVTQSCEWMCWEDTAGASAVLPAGGLHLRAQPFHGESEQAGSWSFRSGTSASGTSSQLECPEPEQGSAFTTNPVTLRGQFLSADSMAYLG